MGTDIHMVLERRVGGKWIGWRTFDYLVISRREGLEIDDIDPLPAALERNYTRFARLAGIRGDGPPPRGLPADVSETTTGWIKYLGDDHSHSWLPLREAAAVFFETERWLDTEDDDFRKIRDPQEFFFGVSRYDDPDQYRLVFWFDN